MKALLFTVGAVLMMVATAAQAVSADLPAQESFEGQAFYGFGGPASNPQQPEQPIIGILTTPNPHTFTDFNSESCPTYIQQTYVEWLASAGIRAVPLRYDMPHEELGKFLDNLNGAFFTGGGMDFQTPNGKIFYDTAEFIVNYTMAANKLNDKFVLWGTCQGFQLVTIASALDQSLLKCDYHGVEPAMLPLTFNTANKTLGTLNANTSRFLAPAFQPESSPLIYSDMATHNTTANLHSCGILPEDYQTNPRLKEMYQVISTNVDVDGRPFASTIEHKTAEIYATQWHPEAAQFWFDVGLSKSPATLRISQYSANFLVTKLRNNKRSFPTPELAFEHLITRWPLGFKPLAAYSGFYCLIDEESLCGHSTDPKKNNTQYWELIAILAIAGLVLSLAFSLILYKFNAAMVKPDSKSDGRKKANRECEKENLINSEV